MTSVFTIFENALFLKQAVRISVQISGEETINLCFIPAFYKEKCLAKYCESEYQCT